MKKGKPKFLQKEKKLRKKECVTIKKLSCFSKTIGIFLYKESCKVCDCLNKKKDLELKCFNCKGLLIKDVSKNWGWVILDKISLLKIFLRKFLKKGLGTKIIKKIKKIKKIIKNLINMIDKIKKKKKTK